MKTALLGTLVVSAVAGGVVVGKATNAAPISNVTSVCIRDDGSSMIEVRTRLGKMEHAAAVRDNASCVRISPATCKAFVAAFDAAKQWAASQDFTK